MTQITLRQGARITVEQDAIGCDTLIPHMHSTNLVLLSFNPRDMRIVTKFRATLLRQILNRTGQHMHAPSNGPNTLRFRTPDQA